MAQATIVYWRDIPAQVIVRAGRRSAKRELSSRFQEAIDMAAMRSGAIGTDAYLEDWRRGAGIDCDDDIEHQADAWKSRLEGEYDDVRMKRLIAAEGFEPEGA